MKTHEVLATGALRAEHLNQDEAGMQSFCMEGRAEGSQPVNFLLKYYIVAQPAMIFGLWHHHEPLEEPQETPRISSFAVASLAVPVILDLHFDTLLADPSKQPAEKPFTCRIDQSDAYPSSLPERQAGKICAFLEV